MNWSANYVADLERCLHWAQICSTLALRPALRLVISSQSQRSS